MRGERGRGSSARLLNALVATFGPKFALTFVGDADDWRVPLTVRDTHLPPEMVRRVVEYAFHAGHY